MEKKKVSYSSSRNHVIAIFVFALISLIVMLGDVGIELYKFCTVEDASAKDFAGTWINTMHIGCAIIELFSAILILILSSIVLRTYLKGDQLTHTRAGLLIANIFFTFLYIVLSVAAALLLVIKNYPPLIQPFLMGFAIIPFVGMTTIGGIMLSAFDKK